MKALVGLACVAVVAFVGYFFWGEWEDYRALERARAAAVLQAEARRAAETLARSNIDMLIATAPPERRTREAMCKHLRTVTGSAVGTYESYVRDCQSLGL